MKLFTSLAVFGFICCAAFAQTSPFDTKASEPPDKEKFSYAVGMNLALQLKKANMDVDVSVISEALKDVMDGKPTKIKESELRQIFAQVQANNSAKKIAVTKTEGHAFLAKNAAEPGVIVLPDGVQYRVLKEGTGPLPDTTNLLVLSFRGTWVDGAEFRHDDNFQVPFMSCPKAWQDVLPRMKVGSKWQLVVPPNIAFQQKDDRIGGYGSTLVYDLELVADHPDDSHPSKPYAGGRLGHAPGEEFLPPPNSR